MASLEGHIALLITLFAQAAYNIDYAMNSIILWQSLVRKWAMLVYRLLQGILSSAMVGVVNKYKD